VTRIEWIDPSSNRAFAGVSLPDRERLLREKPTKTAVLVDERNTALAVGSLWLDAPAGPDGASSAFIGHLAGDDPTHTANVLTTLSREAASAGRRRVLAPIDGSTWRSYRLVVESTGRAPFLLEPQTPAGWESHFTAAGFTRAEMYASLELDDLAPFAGPDDYAEQIAAAGITIRDFDMQRFAADLVHLHTLSLSAFAANPYYAPLAFDEFAAMYKPAVFLFEPGLALIAERNGEALGFIFAYRDGPEKACTVLKTIAVSPNLREAGLASHLTRAVLRRAGQLGCASAVFALMHEGNKSFSWAARHGRVFRRYALMGKDL
jgi:ribosomal protein S18 acetylase RimI-like enzyme